MPMIVAYAIIALAIIAITYKTYLGYGKYKWYTKIGFSLFLLIGWTSPFVCHYLRHSDFSINVINLSNILYICFGYVAILFVVSFIRDTLWMIILGIRRLPISQMDDAQKLKKINIITLVICAIICGIGIYGALREPELKTYDIVSEKIKKPVKMVMIADTHIDVTISKEKVRKLVNRINDLNPDVIVMVGDIIDNIPTKLYSQTKELKKLKAPYGRFITLGNHEFYAGALAWGLQFSSMGFNFQNNTGEKIADTGLYIAGIPDIPSAKVRKMPIKIENALYGADKEDYVVILSHSPKIAEGLTAENVDMQLSGHTHGGQIFPFHYAAKTANDGALAGFYDKNGIKLYVSRGTGYWGPAMRLLAPSEITVFNFLPEGQNAKSTY